MQFLARVSRFVGSTFAAWVLLAAVSAYFFPEGFKWIAPYIVPLLGVIMFGMGLTITKKDFSEVFTRPKDVLIGVLGQFIIMPGLAWTLCKVFNLPPEIAVGVILVGCCPGGTASNVMTFLARGDLALSVTITSVTTLLAPIVTPALIFLLASQWVDVNAWGMFTSIVQVVILPIIAGLVVQHFLGVHVKKCIDVLPLVSVVCIVAIVAAVVAVSQQSIAKMGLLIFIVVVLHNGLGLILGYVMAKTLGMSLAKQKALSIEIGMQNSGLGVSLAKLHFSDPITAVPSAIFSVWHNITGPIAATIFRRMKDQDEVNTESKPS